MAESAPPLAKYFASTEKSVRDKAIKNLSVFLSHSSEASLPPPEMAKLWKGIFYCFWMSDKPLVQQALAGELAELLLVISTTPASLAFLRGFWSTMVREWNGIDRLRVDKYYMLIRKFVNASFRLMMKEKWKESVCEECNDILTRKGGPLCPNDPKVPAGLAFHLSDIYLEELNKVIPPPTTAPENPEPVPLLALLLPFLVLLTRTNDSTTFRRVQESLLDPLLFALSSRSSNDIEPEEDRSSKRPKLSASSSAFPNLIENSSLSPKEGRTPTESLKKGLIKHLFTLASGEDTRVSNRKKLYAICRNNDDDDED